VDDRVALAWIFKQCGTASSSVKPTSMGISDAVRILSDGARHSLPNAASIHIDFLEGVVHPPSRSSLACMLMIPSGSSDRM
jgi:hypothetical protein